MTKLKTYQTNIITTLIVVMLLITGGITSRVLLSPEIPATFKPENHKSDSLLHAAVPSEPAKIFRLSFADAMKKVYAIGREVGHPETLQAILLKETGGGRSIPIGNAESPVGKRSYGLMQVQVVAARSILERNPTLAKRYFPNRTPRTLFDEEIIALLLTNDEANIRIAAYHFNLYLKLSDGDWDRAVAAYNAGIGGVERIPVPSEFPYVVDVKAKIEDVVRPFNLKHNL